MRLRMLMLVSLFPLAGACSFDSNGSADESTLNDLGYELPCATSSTPEPATLILRRSQQLLNVRGTAEVKFDDATAVISPEQGEVIRQYLFSDGSFTGPVKVRSSCRAAHITSGKILDEYRGYNAYPVEAIKAARAAQMAWRSGEASQSEIAARLFDLYMEYANPDELRALAVAKANGISDELVKRTFLSEVEIELSAGKTDRVFASAWDNLSHGLLIELVKVPLRLELPKPLDCGIDYEDKLSAAERFAKQERCQAERQQNYNTFFNAGQAEQPLRSRTIITVERALNGKGVLNGDLEVMAIESADVNADTLKVLRRMGRVLLSY